MQPVETETLAYVAPQLEHLLGDLGGVRGNLENLGIYLRHPMLFHPPHEELSDEEIAAILRQAIQGAGRLPWSADVYLAGMRAEHLVEGLRAAGMLVVRPTQQWRMHSEGPLLTRSHPEN